MRDRVAGIYWRALMNPLICFLLGMVFGASIGAFVMAFLIAARDFEE